MEFVNIALGKLLIFCPAWCWHQWNEVLSDIDKYPLSECSVKLLNTSSTAVEISTRSIKVINKINKNKLFRIYPIIQDLNKEFQSLSSEPDKCCKLGRGYMCLLFMLHRVCNWAINSSVLKQETSVNFGCTL